MYPTLSESRVHWETIGLERARWNGWDHSMGSGVARPKHTRGSAMVSRPDFSIGGRPARSVIDRSVRSTAMARGNGIETPVRVAVLC